MSSISPWFRGYRLALRDVQRGIDLYARDMPERNSAMSAILMSADEIALELRYLKSRQSSARKEAQAKEDQHRLNLRLCCGTKAAWDRILFDHGYRGGLERALAIVSAYGLEMNDPNARHAIGEVDQHLARYKVKIADCEPGKIRTLRRQKFIIIR